MRAITPELLVAAVGCRASIAKTWAHPLTEACGAYVITSPARLAAFLAQVGHESAGLTRTVEVLGYRAERLRELGAASPAGSRWRAAGERAAELALNPRALANFVYGGRLGNDQADDGWNFRGRGLLQATGRTNYEAVTELVRRRDPDAPDFVAHPDALSEPRWAAMSAAAIWNDRELNALADAGAFDEITKRINGGQHGREDRRRRYAVARAALTKVAA